LWREGGSELVERAGGAQGADVGVDHGGAVVGVVQEFLNCTDIVPDFQEVGGKALATRAWFTGGASDRSGSSAIPSRGIDPLHGRGREE
jgi:hypothetical protein